jgi:hypothetical protein
MADKKKDEPQESEDSALVAAAKTIGKAAGKIAAVVTHSSAQKAGQGRKKGTRPVKKTKPRLPRKTKKAQKKAAKAKG